MVEVASVEAQAAALLQPLPSDAGRVCFALVGPILGACEPEPSALLKKLEADGVLPPGSASASGSASGVGRGGSGGGNNTTTAGTASAASAVFAAAEEGSATYRQRVLVEVDRPAWLCAVAVDVLQGDNPIGAKNGSGAVVRSPAALVQGRGKPFVFVLKGLRPLRRYLIKIEGLSSSSSSEANDDGDDSRTATLHTPPAPGVHHQLQCVVLGQHDASALAEDVPPPPASAVLASTSAAAAFGDNSAAAAVKGSAKGGGDGGVSWNLYGDLAERLAVPWHGVDLVMHLGSVGVDMRPVLQEAIAFIVASEVGEGGPYGYSTAGDGDSPAGLAAKAQAKAFDEAIKERFRDPLRRAWESPSLRSIFRSCPQLMLPGTSDYGLEAASRKGLLAELLAAQEGAGGGGAGGKDGIDGSGKKVRNIEMRCVRGEEKVQGG